MAVSSGSSCSLTRWLWSCLACCHAVYFIRFLTMSNIQVNIIQHKLITRQKYPCRIWSYDLVAKINSCIFLFYWLLPAYIAHWLRWILFRSWDFFVLVLLLLFSTHLMSRDSLNWLTSCGVVWRQRFCPAEHIACAGADFLLWRQLQLAMTCSCSGSQSWLLLSVLRWNYIVLYNQLDCHFLQPCIRHCDHVCILRWWLDGWVYIRLTWLSST